MKRPQPDIGEVTRATFVRDLGNSRRFVKRWGTTTVSGVEVLIARHYYYPSISETSEKVFRYLGIYDDVVDAQRRSKGITHAWITLNKNKASIPSAVDPVAPLYDYNGFVATNLNKIWWDVNDGPMPEGITLTTSIVIGAKLQSSTSADTVDTVETSELLDPSWEKTQLVTAITNYYETLWDTCNITQEGVGVINKGSFTDDVTKVTTPDEDDLSPNDPWLSTIARYALRNNEIPATVKDVEVGYNTSSNGRLYHTYVVTIEIPYFVIGETDTFIQDITNDLLATYSSRTRTPLSYPNGYWTQTIIKAMNVAYSDLAVFDPADVDPDLAALTMYEVDLEEDPTLITRDYLLWEDQDIEATTAAGYPSVWVNLGGRWYLRADAFNNPRQDYGIPTREFTEYVMSLVDTGYQKKKVKWWKKIVAIIVAVVIVLYVGDFRLATLTWQSVAVITVAVSIALTVLSLVFYAAGMEGWATAFAEANKMIEPLVIVASIVIAYGKLQAMTAEALKKEAADVTMKEVMNFVLDGADDLISNFVEDMVSNLHTGFDELLSGQITDLSMDFAGKALRVINFTQELKLKELNNRNRDLKAEYEKEAKETWQENDLIPMLARISGKPATADWSTYAGLFDRPYERSGGTLALGNVQRTTKQAIRRADYNDPAFAGIIGV